MSIPSAKYLKVKAANRLEGGNAPRTIVLIYAGILAGSSLIANAARYFLANRIDQTGGLQGISTRSALSTASTAVTIAYMLLTVCLSLGYAAAMLRIARGQFASARTLKAGLERVWLLLRTRLLQGIVLVAMSLALCMLVVNIYMLTPFSNRLTAAMLPLLGEGVLSTDAVLSAWEGAYTAMLPVTLIYLAALMVLLWFFTCTYRMVDYLLIERPQLGAFGALRESRRMMRGNMKMMLRVDLSYWWYYLLRAAAGCLVYLDVILAIMGIPLPLSPAAGFFAIMLVYLAADFALRYFFSNRVAVTYALFYDALCPKEEKSEAILGNIFQM